MSAQAPIAVVGGGAMGGVWAAHFARAGHRVTLVDTAPSVVNAVSRNGIAIETADGPQPAVPVTATSDPEAMSPAGVVHFFVKAHHTAAAARLARPLVGPHTTVVTQQNGWGNADVLAQVFAAEQIVGGVTYHSATAAEPGRVRHTGTGLSFVGPYLDGGDRARAESLAELMSAVGLQTVATAAVKTEIWKKLILNTATLPTAALTRLCAGDLGRPGPLLDLIDAIAAEAVRVAAALGHDIDLSERLQRIHATLARAGTGKPSMLQDVEAGRKTEVEVVNGAVATAAERLGIDAPLNRAMVALVGGLEGALAA